MATAALLLLLSAENAVGQNLDATGLATGFISDELIVKSTTPVLFSCSHYAQGTCFRMYLEISPKTAPRADVAIIPFNNNLYQTEAFSSVGARCVSQDLGGMPKSYLSSTGNGQLFWSGSPFTATQTKPATVMVEFNCDGKVISGDEVTVQFAFAADITGRGPRVARYVFKNLIIRSLDRR